MSNKYIFFLLLFFPFTIIYAQSVTLLGNIKAKDNLESIHIINKNKKLYAASNQLGIFKIEAEKNDTIVFSSIQYKPKTVIVSAKNIENKSITITLDLLVNELEEVIVGNTLTGNLEKDVNNLNVKPQINFYDVGIPGYTGKRKSQSERRLAEAGELKAKDVLIGALTGSIPINPILNAISGRTKMLKKRVALEANTSLMNSLKSRVSESFFNDHPLDKDKRMDFFYFCAEDKDFKERCRSDLEALQFMAEKYIKYKENLTSKE